MREVVLSVGERDSGQNGSKNDEIKKVYDICSRI